MNRPNSLKRPRALPPQIRNKKKSFPYFLLAACIFCIWMIWQSVIPTLPKPSEPPRFYCNPSREDLRLTVLSAIKKARSSIFLCMFGLNDPSVLKTLSEKIKKGMPTTVYYDASGSPDVRKVLSGPDIHPIRLSGIMHQKILVLDDEMVFLGSANFTPQSLKMHDNLVIGFASKKIAAFLKEKVPNQSGYMKCKVGGQEVELWILPDPKGHALTDMKRKIRSASQSLKIALFTLTHNVLIDEIIQAKRRGVDVKVVLDMHSALGASSDAVDKLEKAGVSVLCSQGVQLMHHKFVYIDGKTLVTGSANWTKGAFAKNSDTFFILHRLNEKQRGFMDRLWHSIETPSQKPKKRLRPSPSS